MGDRYYDDEEGYGGIEYGDDFDDGDGGYRDEADYFERVVRRDILEQAGIERKSVKLQRSSIEKFAEQSEAIFNSLVDNTRLVQREELVNVLTRAKKIDKINRKNPSAFILAYIVISNSRDRGRIDKKVFTNVCSTAIPVLEDRSVQPEDVLRYCRLWILTDN